MHMLAWFAKNSVAANVLMGLILLAGFAGLSSVEKEVFPHFSPQQIDIKAYYPGATPEEIAERVCIPIEEAIYDLEGIHRINTKAGQTWRQEDACSIIVYATRTQALQPLIAAIHARIQNIPKLPGGIDRIDVREGRRQGDDGVIWVALYGRTDQIHLSRLGEDIQADLSRIPGVNLANNYGYVPYELAIEIPQERLRRSKLTLKEIAETLRQSSLDLPGGRIKSKAGDIVLRTQGQALTADTFGEQVLLTASDGSRVPLRDIAAIRDGLAERDFIWHHNGMPCQGWEVFAKDDAVEVARRIKDYVRNMDSQLPDGLRLITWYDDSQAFDERVGTLLENGLMGFVLIFLVLTVFLSRHLAFWVATGVITALVGTLGGMWLLGISLNMLSLFGFVLALGILVDDTIIVSESINRHQEAAAAAWTDSASPRPIRADMNTATIRGLREVAKPVTLAVVTTMLAFLPGLFLTGWAESLLGPICSVVVLALGLSLIEALCILPAHLTHAVRESSRGVEALRQWATRGLNTLIHRAYLPFLDRAFRQPFLLLTSCAAVMMISAALVAGGHLRLTIQADVPKDTIALFLNVPPGTPYSAVQTLSKQVEQAYSQLRDSLESRQATGASSPVSGIESMIYEDWAGFWVELAPGARQRFSVAALAREWRENIGDIGKATLDFQYKEGDTYHDLEWRVSATNSETVQSAVDKMLRHLTALPGVFDAKHSHIQGRPQLSLKLRPEAERLSLRLEEVADQVRQAYLGEEVQRFYRRREQVKVMVRLPLSERQQLDDFRQLPILLPTGGQAPLESLATWQWLPQAESVTRENRQELVWVRARLNPDLGDAHAIYTSMESGLIDELTRNNPGLRIGVGPAREEQEAALRTLGRNTVFAMVLIYAILAVSFRTYRLPLLFLLAVPLAWVGGIATHLVLGLSLSMESLVGMIGASGVVINDSLVLLHDVRRRQRDKPDLPLHTCIREACQVRFRPILLTFLTTFAGLVPMLFETSAQAQFLVPMAVAFASGLLGGMLATLFIVPVTALLLEHIQPLDESATLFKTDMATSRSQGT
ncbi:MAG: efflux RND transporter permease subunit [Nitrospirales bacterium]|nr:efflux RND transporter permease subunit [Nitrospirales bacterium]